MGRVILLPDFKSGSFNAPEHRLQLGGYYGSDKLYHRKTDTVADKPAIDYCLTVHLNTQNLRPMMVMDKTSSAEAYKVFLHALELYRYLAKQGLTKAPSRYPILGENYVSVTEVLQYAVAKPGLLNWYAKMAKEGKSPEAERDKRASQGTRFHKLGENVLIKAPLDCKNTDEENLVKSVQSWVDELEIEPLYVEQIVVNTEQYYAGSMDSIVSTNEEKFKAWVLQSVMK